MSESVKTRLLKLLALRERGVGGEVRNAGYVLQRLLRENNMTEADLVDGEFDRKVEWFSFRTKREKQLLVQIIFSVVDDWKGSSYSSRGKSRQIGVKLSKPEFAEVTLLYSVYLQDFRKTLDLALWAFIQANRIFGLGVEEVSDLTEEDEKMLRLAGGIDPIALPRAQIGMRNEVEA